MAEIQGSVEWFAQRCGKVTASRVADVMAKTKSGESASRKNYMMELLCQRLTGEIEQGFVTQAMQRGIELETVARSEFEVKTGIIVKESGFIEHPTIKMFGASPDGLLVGGGILEIKCPNTAQHVDFLVTKKIPEKYQWQMLAQMSCSGQSFGTFDSYDDRMPENLRTSFVNIDKDIEKEEIMLVEITKFLQELNELESKIRNMK